MATDNEALSAEQDDWYLLSGLTCEKSEPGGPLALARLSGLSLTTTDVKENGRVVATTLTAPDGSAAKYYRGKARCEEAVRKQSEQLAPYFDAPPSTDKTLPGDRSKQNLVPGGFGSGFPSSADYYPEASRRLEEQGSVKVHVCTDGHGDLTLTPSVAESSGSLRLDQAAIRLAIAGSTHYRPGTVDGRPVNSCFSFLVNFCLRR